MGRKRRTPPSQTELEEESSSSLGECTLEALCLKASPPHPSYIYWWFRADLRHNFVTCNSNLYHVVLPLDRMSVELGRSPAGVDHQHHRSVVTLPENSSTSSSLLLHQEGRDRHRAVRVLNAEVPSVRR